MDDKDAVIVSQDEVHFMLGTLVTRSWYKKGTIPTVGSAPGKSGIPLSGFVALGTGEIVITSPATFNFETTIASIRVFLGQCKLEENQHVYMILDNASWHKKAKRLIQDESNEEYADIREKVTFLDIPPYSPDLNPIEQLWRKTRKEVTHNRYFSSLKDLWNALSNFFGKFAESNDEIANLCAFDFFKEETSHKNRIQVGMNHTMSKNENGNNYRGFSGDVILSVT